MNKLTKYFRREERIARLAKKKRPYYFKYESLYNNFYKIENPTFWDKLRCKLFWKPLANLEWKSFMHFQKRTLAKICGVHLVGYHEWSDIFYNLDFLLTSMALYHKNFGHTIDADKNVREIWYLRKKLRQFLNVETKALDYKDNILKKKFGKNTELQIDFKPIENSGCSSMQSHYIGNETGTQTEISDLDDVLFNDPIVGYTNVYKEENRLLKEIVNYFIDNYYKWWD